MSEPSLALQNAIVIAIKADSSIGVGARVYDRVPTAPTFPYVTVGDDQSLSDAAECLEGSEDVTTNLHVWSHAANGKVEAKQIAGALKSLLNDAALVLDGFRLIDLSFQSVQHLSDPDGITSHSVVTFRALIDEE